MVVWQLSCRGSYHFLKCDCVADAVPLYQYTHWNWYSFRRPRKDDRLSQPPGVLIQRPTGLELRTRGSQANTLTTEPTPGSDWCENVQVVFLPPNTTSLLQPMDQGVIAAFKAYYVKHTMLQLIKKTDKDKLSIKEFWRTYNIKMALENIKDSWVEVSVSTMNAVWKKVWPECVHNFTGFADVPLITSQIVDLAQEAGFEEVDEEDVDDLLESHAEPFSNEDLMELEQQWALEEEEEEYAVTPSSKHLTMKILSSFENAIEFVIEQDPNLERSTDFSCVVNDALCCYKELYAAKKKKAIQPTRHAFFKPKDAAPTTSTIQDAPSTSCQETVPAGEESDGTVSSEEGDDSATPQV